MGRRLRQVYRSLIVVAAGYDYVSLPFVIAGVLVAAALVGVAFLWMGRLPIVLLLSVAAGALVTVWKSVRSLFTRVHRTHPGRVLEPSEAPGLWALTSHVADAMGTRPIEEIRVTPGTELAVYEYGTRRERRAEAARRVLVLGVGLLDRFPAGAVLRRAGARVRPLRAP